MNVREFPSRRRIDSLGSLFMSEKQSLSSIIGEEEMESMARVGIALRLVQTVEIVLRLVMTFYSRRTRVSEYFRNWKRRPRPERKRRSATSR